MQKISITVLRREQDQQQDFYYNNHQMCRLREERFAIGPSGEGSIYADRNRHLGADHC